MALAAGINLPTVVEGQEGMMDAQVERFAAELDSLRVAHGIPGLSVATLRDGRVLMARGFGVADVERGIPATAETPYDVASVAKPISSVAVLRLAVPILPGGLPAERHPGRPGRPGCARGGYERA